MNGRSLLLGCAVLAGVLLCGAAGPLPHARAEGKLGEDKFKPGDRAPEFVNAFFLDGKPALLADLAGKKVLLLNFWGLRCGACLEEMPYLDAIWQKYQDKGLAVWGVDTDGADVKTIQETLVSVKVSVSYPLITDVEFTVTDSYTNFLVPLTLVIDRKGVVRYIHTGFEKGREAEYEEAVRKALGS